MLLDYTREFLLRLQGKLDNLGYFMEIGRSMEQEATRFVNKSLEGFAHEQFNILIHEVGVPIPYVFPAPADTHRLLSVKREDVDPEVLSKAEAIEAELIRRLEASAVDDSALDSQTPSAVSSRLHNLLLSLVLTFFSLGLAMLGWTQTDSGNKSLIQDPMGWVVLVGFVFVLSWRLIRWRMRVNEHNRRQRLHQEEFSESQERFLAAPTLHTRRDDDHQPSSSSASDENHDGRIRGVPTVGEERSVATIIIHPGQRVARAYKILSLLAIPLIAIEIVTLGLRYLAHMSTPLWIDGAVVISSAALLVARRMTTRRQEHPLHGAWQDPQGIQAPRRRRWQRYSLWIVILGVLFLSGVFLPLASAASAVHPFVLHPALQMPEAVSFLVSGDGESGIDSLFFLAGLVGLNAKHQQVRAADPSMIPLKKKGPTLLPLDPGLHEQLQRAIEGEDPYSLTQISQVTGVNQRPIHRLDRRRASHHR